MRRTVFAVPGNIDALTGGYIYEKNLLAALRRTGREVEHLALPGSYPEPTPADFADTVAALAAIPAQTPVLLDGFLSGATDPAGLAQMRAPFVAITHHPLALETGLDPDRALWLRATERANLARAAHVLVPSPHTGEVLTAEYGVQPARITVAPPGVTRPEPAAPEPGDPLILSVGQLVPRKGHDVLLRALARLVHLPWRLEIIGKDGPAGPDLMALGNELGLSYRVTFAGTLPPERLSLRYGQATIFALATLYEGYGMVFAEALAAGLPIVAGAGGAVPDTVPREAGHLCPPGDVEATAAALEHLLTDDAARTAMAAAAKRHGDALPSWDDNARIAGAVLDAL